MEKINPEPYKEFFRQTAKLMHDEMNDPLLNEEIERNNMPICVECNYYQEDLECQNRDLPLTDFIYGHRKCYELNWQGNCKGFKAKSKDESIYESEEDEKLAKIHRK